MDIRGIRKRDGRTEPFDAGRIESAIRAAERALGRSESHAPAVAAEVVQRLQAMPGPGTPTVEQVQDMVENVLIADRETDLAKAYILYRRRHAEIRQAKAALGVQDDLKLTLNAIRVLERRYLRKDETGRVVETPTEMFRRVARAVAAAEAACGGEEAAAAEAFFGRMSRLEFLPNSPTLMNAGTPVGQLSACFVLPVPDSLDGIFEAIKEAAVIHQSGGGTGFSFSRIRPRGARVSRTGGVASGPLSFLEVFDKTTDVIKQAGRRRGANMAVLDVTHPDLEDFVRAKERMDRLTNFNLSVSVTDAFMAAARRGERYDLVAPQTGRPAGRRDAREVLDMICDAAWRCGDPGLVFLDAINRANPTPALGRIETTNPCGEQPLLPHESCNLGSINLVRFLRGRDIAYDRLGEAVDDAVRFLDDVIEVNRYPVPAIAEQTLLTRKIGLGVMGFADVLFRMDIPYDSEEGVRLAERVMGFISERGRQASARLAEKRGSFPAFDRSVWPGRGFSALRNATVTTIAPTGTIGLIAGVSSGIEPVFALRYWRQMAEGVVLTETHPELLSRAADLGLDEDRLLAACGVEGGVQRCDLLPAEIRRVLVTARDISVAWHVRMQAAFQCHTDNGVSKTINLPREATVEAVRETFLLAHELGCKGVTVYREGSRDQDLLHRGALPCLTDESCSAAPGVRECA